MNYDQKMIVIFKYRELRMFDYHIIFSVMLVQYMSFCFHFFCYVGTIHVRYIQFVKKNICTVVKNVKCDLHSRVPTMKFLHTFLFLHTFYN